MNKCEAQAALILLGYNLCSTGTDGDWGKRSKAAYAIFQRQRGLPPDGRLAASAQPAQG